jgi:molecular chaperone DnaK (HSP70)
MSNNQNTVLGIDLGTRNSCVGVWKNKKFHIILDQYGNRCIPSIVSFYNSIKLVGQNALSMKDVNPKNTIFDVKRLIGRKFSDETLLETLKYLTYEIVTDDSDNVLIKIDNHNRQDSTKAYYRPEEICGYILSEIRQTAIKYLECDVTDAIITVPAYFNDAQRQATIDSAKIAGLNVIQLINEPTAAALMHGVGRESWLDANGESKTIMVYDMGAGTLDVVIMLIESGTFKILSVSGNMHLGGEDIDNLLLTYVLKDFCNKYRIVEFDLEPLQYIKLKNAVENAKKMLSSTEKAVICIDNFHRDEKLYKVLSRKEMDSVCNDMYKLCIKPIHDALDAISMTKDKIDEIVVVGGSSKIIKLQELILNFFNETKIKELTLSSKPDEIVAAGAAMYGYTLMNPDDPFSENIMLLDVVPLSLGIETLCSQMTTLIPRNTIIPVTKIAMFTTDTDYQDSVTIKIFEGERKQTKNNFHLGSFMLSGFNKAPRGHAQIKITYHVDINGILTVKAFEKKSGVENAIEITSTWSAKGRLSDDEINNMIMDSEKNNEIDILYSMKIIHIHHIQTMCNTVLANLKSGEMDNMSQKDKEMIEYDINSVLKWHSEINIQTIHIDELKSKKKYLEDKYALFILIIDKNTITYNANDDCIAANVHGDDDEIKHSDKYQILDNTITSDVTDIKEIKKDIMKLCDDIKMAVENPICVIDDNDKKNMIDYINSVLIWIYTTSSTSIIEYKMKIEEINTYTDVIMNKYEKIFSETSFSAKNELELVCMTLKLSLESKYINLDSSDYNELEYLIETTETLLKNGLSEDECIIYLNKVRESCNLYYDKISSSESNPIIPDKLSRLQNKPNEDAVLLEINVDSLI